MSYPLHDERIRYTQFGGMVVSTIRDIMVSDRVTLDVSTRTSEARTWMLRSHGRCLPVVGSDGRARAMVTDVALCRREETVGLLSVPIECFLEPDDTLGEAVDLMRSEARGELPVLDDGRWLGVVRRTSSVLSLSLASPLRRR